MRHDHTYATTSDYRDAIGDNPAELTRNLLVSASRRIDRALIGARYDVDDDGNPTDCDVREAFRSAVCHQAEDMIESGDMGTGRGLAYSDLSIGSVKIARSQASGNHPSGVDVARKALDDLYGVGLLPIDPTLVG